MKEDTDERATEVLDDLRRRLSSRLGSEFVTHQDELIRCMADFTAEAVMRQPCFDGRHREAWMQYLVEELFPQFPWEAAGGPGWEQVQQNPPKPTGWALGRVGRAGGAS